MLRLVNGHYKQYNDRSRTEHVGFEYPTEHTDFLRYHVYTALRHTFFFYPRKGGQSVKLTSHLHLLPIVCVIMCTAVPLIPHILSWPCVYAQGRHPLQIFLVQISSVQLDSTPNEKQRRQR